MSISISNEIEFGNFFYCNGDIIFGNRKAFYEKQFESFDDLQNTWLTFLKQ